LQRAQGAIVYRILKLVMGKNWLQTFHMQVRDKIHKKFACIQIITISVIGKWKCWNTAE